MKEKNNDYIQQFILLRVTLVPFWRVSTGRKQCSVSVASRIYIVFVQIKSQQRRKRIIFFTLFY